jgi:hypothetical protein
VSFRKHAKASVTINKVSSQKSQPSTGGGGGQRRGDAGSKSQQQNTNKKSNVIPADVKLHRRLNANLRGIVEKYASTPAGWRRKPNARRIDVDFGGSNSQSSSSEKGGGDHTTSTTTSTLSSARTNTNNHDQKKIEANLRAAFALRESKEHEQRDLVNATLKAENSKLHRSWGFTPSAAGAGMGGGAPPGVLPPFEEASNRKKRLDGIAKQLKDKEKCSTERAKWTQIAKKGKELVRCLLRSFLPLMLNVYMFVLTTSLSPPC